MHWHVCLNVRRRDAITSAPRKFQRHIYLLGTTASYNHFAPPTIILPPPIPKIPANCDPDGRECWKTESDVTGLWSVFFANNKSYRSFAPLLSELHTTPFATSGLNVQHSLFLRHFAPTYALRPWTVNAWPHVPHRLASLACRITAEVLSWKGCAGKQSTLEEMFLHKKCQAHRQLREKTTKIYIPAFFVLGCIAWKAP